MDWLEYENKAYELGFNVICGVDEAGRGPLAGPVYAAAVILPRGYVVDGVNDSKKLSEKKRDLLFDKIVDECICYSVGTASVEEIDEINILQATFLAMRRAVDGLSVKPDIALIDGNKKPGLDIEQWDIVKGDATSANIAAASIIAKVSRDRYMLKLAEKYPQYQFEKHKGYGTKLHYEMLDKYGISEVHRKSFLKNIWKRKMNNKGKIWEIEAANYLRKHRYKLVDANYTTRFGEIDLIVKNRKYICFVEVKQRDVKSIALPREFVTYSKQQKIIACAKMFLMQNKTNLQPRFDVIEIYTDNNKIKSIKHLENAFDLV